jgi:AcrR family transcriptional regulator
VDARERLILAAERLVAERGVDVSLRDVALAAGQRNNSAVHYHFGTRDGLLRAVIERRNEGMEAERLERLADHDLRGAPDGVTELLDILWRPMLTIPYAQGSTHYARFLAQVRSHPLLNEPLWSAEHWPAVQAIMARLERVLLDQTGLARPAVRRRLASMSSAAYALVADQERSSTPGRSEAAADDVVAMLVGLVTAVPEKAGVSAAARP